MKQTMPILPHPVRSPLFGLLVSAAMLLPAGCAPETATPAKVQGNEEYVHGALAYQEGDRERAIAALQSALRENPDLIMARFLLGSIYRDKGEYESAAEQYKRVVELDPFVYSNHYNLGLMYHLLDRLQDAAASYLQALKLNPQDVKSNMNLGLVYTALGRADLGLPYARKATEIDPRSAEAFANYGVVLDSLRQYPQAEAAYRRAMELDSARVETPVNLASNLVSQKRYREAISVFEQVLKTKDSSLLRQRYGHALLLACRTDDAIKQFQNAIAQNAGNYQAYNGIGDALLGQYRASAMLDEKKRSEALASWKKSLELNPNQPRISALIKEYSEGQLFP